MLTYNYSDAYLAPLITQDREAQAVADIATYGTFTAEWTERLVKVRAYIITCQESQKSSEDLFSTKLASYRKELEQLLPHARAASEAATGAVGQRSIISIPLERA